MPSGWEKLKISELLSRKIIQLQIDGNHGELYPKTSEFVESGIPYLSANCIVEGRLDISKAKFLTEEKFKKLKKGISQRDDVLFAHNATVGPTALNTIDGVSVLSTTLTLYRCNKEALNPLYLKSYFSSPLFSSQYTKVMAQSTRNQVPITAQREFEVLLPPLAEQEKIANIVSTWDEAIEKLDRIIIQKEKRNRGFGQRLLFNGTNKYRLDDLCTPKQWKTISSKELLEEGIPVFGANSWIGFYSEANHQEDCIAVTCRGATCGTVNYVKGPSYITGNSMALDSLKDDIIDRNFLYFYLRTLGLNGIISGSAQPQITGAAIGKVELSLPSLSDQIKVSSILMDATKEVDCLKELKDKIATQKQGLMQQLLTGKKRVKV